MRIEKYVAVEPYGHELRHGLPLGQSLLHEQLQLDARREGRHGRLDVFRQQSVHGDIGSRNVILDMRLAVAQDILLEKRRNLHDGHDPPFAHQTLAFVHRLHSVGDQRRGRVVDHLRHLARKGRVVLVEHGHRHVADRPLVEQQGEEGERRRREEEHQHEVHRLVRQPPQFPPQHGSGIFQQSAHRYRPILSQSTSTLIPGRMFSAAETGRAFTAKVRMSNPPCVWVAAHVAKSACGAM